MNVDRTFTKTQIQILRDNWSTERSVPPLDRLVRLVDQFDDEVLKQLAQANIKFLSVVADMRLVNGRAITQK